jgi:drug/metabolite transporter (DMT)-like permease
LKCVVDGTRRGTSAGREGGWYHRTAGRPTRAARFRTRQTDAVVAIIGGLGAAMLWAAATLCSSRSSRMLGSRVVLGWVMVVGVIVGFPVAALSPGPATLEPSTLALLGLAGICYVVGLQLAYAALRIGKVSIVAPIVATEGAVAALIAVALGDTIGIVAGLMLAVIATGVILSTLEPRADVPAGDFDFVADALDGPAVETTEATTPTATDEHPVDTRRAALLSIVAALAFGLGLVAAGKSAALVPVAWVALSARLVGIVVVVIPLLMQRRFRLTRVALPLVLIAGVAEVFGSMLSAWGSRDSIAIAAVMGSQFAAFAAVAAYFLFRERLGRLQVAGVVLIVGGVTVLAAVTA